MGSLSTFFNVGVIFYILLNRFIKENDFIKNSSSYDKI